MTDGRLAERADLRRRGAFFNLAKIGLPVGAVASFLHRVSGVLLFFHCSLAGPTEFAALAMYARAPWVRVLALVLVWALSHHVLAGVRHLLMDGGVGWQLQMARRSAWLVNSGAIVLTLFVASRVL
jgi:succinate dehydrogenase / fumarate reductase cytochrome b subunit